MDRTFANEVTIRRMELADLDAVKEIDDLSFNLPWPRRAFLFELQDNPAGYLYVAEVPDSVAKHQVIGMIGLWLIIDEVHINTLAVHPAHRRRGVGEQLVSAALVRVRALGAHSATLEVRESNLGAQTLYRKLGFRIAGLRPRYYKDNHEDAVLMTIPNLDKI
jgi:[ribosomal protein S18]-alanine N-acetyltransferase